MRDLEKERRSHYSKTARTLNYDSRSRAAAFSSNFWTIQFFPALSSNSDFSRGTVPLIVSGCIFVPGFLHYPRELELITHPSSVMILLDQSAVTEHAANVTKQQIS